MNRNRQGTARRGRNIRPAHSRNFTCRVLLSKLSDETVQEINNRKYCQLCHRSPSDPLLYGKLYSIGQVTVHYYCLVIPLEIKYLQTFQCRIINTLQLFACYLSQNGDDDEGIHGFLEQDIQKEIVRSKSVVRMNLIFDLHYFLSAILLLLNRYYILESADLLALLTVCQNYFFPVV
jgi:hypothetical protein